jgi:hypothetical protein
MWGPNSQNSPSLGPSPTLFHTHLKKPIQANIMYGYFWVMPPGWLTTLTLLWQRKKVGSSMELSIWPLNHLPFALQVKEHFAANSLLESGVENQWWWKLICVGGFVYSFVSFKPCAQVFYHSSRFRHPMAIPTQKSDILEADFASTQVLGVVGKCSGWHSRCLAKSSKTCSGGTILVMVL